MFNPLNKIDCNKEKFQQLLEMASSLSREFNCKFLKLWGRNYNIPFDGYLPESPNLVRQTSI